ncbi:hypothetical protein CLOM_g13260 [Closterium sp. NIES-68]|nr:hypothetical protein CLOM_g13260 [Closterium sp. NIES-68]GJP57490.1 hypothetical protein CLOP_g12203 [Closterium sp. NIES-67]
MSCAHALHFRPAHPPTPSAGRRITAHLAQRATCPSQRTAGDNRAGSRHSAPRRRPLSSPARRASVPGAFPVAQHGSLKAPQTLIHPPSSSVSSALAPCASPSPSYYPSSTLLASQIPCVFTCCRPSALPYAANPSEIRSEIRGGIRGKIGAIGARGVQQRLGRASRLWRAWRAPGNGGACGGSDVAARRGGRIEGSAQQMGRAVRARASGAAESGFWGGEQRGGRGEGEIQASELSAAAAGRGGGSVMGGAVSAGRGSGEVDGEPMGDRPVLCFPGGGMFFYWQMGAASTIAQHGAVEHARLVGASAGALAATLTACGVDGRAAARTAFELSLANGVWDRPAGLAGVWGRLVGEWLDLMLPPDAHMRCTHRLSLHIVTLPSIRHRAPWFQRQVVSAFPSRGDLIACCLASVHIPFFMDARPWTLYRGRRCVDGSILAMPEHLAPVSASSLFLDFALDEEMRRRRWDFLSLGREEKAERRRTHDDNDPVLVSEHYSEDDDDALPPTPLTPPAPWPSSSSSLPASLTPSPSSSASSSFRSPPPSALSSPVSPTPPVSPIASHPPLSAPARTWRWIEEMMERGEAYAMREIIDTGALHALLPPVSHADP